MTSIDLSSKKMIVHMGRNEVLSKSFFRSRSKLAKLALFKLVASGVCVTPLHVERNVRLHAGLVIARAALPVPDLPVRGVDVLGQGVSPPRREVALIAREICLTLVDSHDVLF